MPLTDVYTNVLFYGNRGSVNNLTPVVVIPNPGVGAPSYIVDKEDIGILNLDTANITVALTISGDTSHIIEKFSLSPGDKWISSSRYVIKSGETLTLTLSSIPVSNETTFNASYYQVID